ncbi:MAG: tetratricopeptide repeat protein [Elusimicrobiota bacterium]
MKPSSFLVLLLLSSAARAESFQAWAARGAREEREKNPKAAAESYSNALSEWKESDGESGKARVLCARAALRDRAGDEAGATADYSGCLAVDKRNAKAFDRRGALRLKVGRTSASIDDFDKAIEIDLRFAGAYADRARAYERQGDRKFAAEDYRRACALGEKAACPGARKSAAAAKPRDDGAALYRACLGSLRACVGKGKSAAECVGRARTCERGAVAGCCPAACVQAYGRARNDGRGSDAAFREIFISGPACAAPASH